MCGVAGFIDFTQSMTSERLTQIAEQMATQLVHRGPDDAGSLADAGYGIAFGFRRLAIQDLRKNGNQPMVSANRRYVIVYNGEIYNFKELRTDLEDAGSRSWRSETDTEVLLEGIARLGVAGALDRCDGMFAFAVWDKQSRRLHLARDRMGEKPLYYGWSGNCLLFASELKALVSHPEWSGAVEPEALAAYMRYSYVPAPLSIYRGIYKLPPAHWLTFDLDSLTPGALPEPRPYWDMRAMVERGAIAPFDGGPDEAVALLRETLSRSVTRRMIADVPLGAFLSGGLDSSAIVALMQSNGNRPVRTFTIGFGDDVYDEAKQAQAVAAHLGTEHTEIYADFDAPLRVVDRMPRVFDEPFADKSQLPTMLLAELTRDHVTTVLSGDGGDELFGGYPRYGAAQRAWRRLSGRPSYARKLASWAVQRLPLAALNGMSSIGTRPGRWGDKLFRLLSDATHSAPERVHERFHSLWRRVDRPTPPYYGGYFINPELWPRDADTISRLMYADAMTYLPDDILVKVDRTTMAVNLEARAPLLSREVVELAWSLPITYKIRDGMTKWPMRRLLKEFLPGDLIERPKQGFEPPLATWLRGPLRDWADDLLSPERLKNDELLTAAPILAAWQEHRSGQRDRNGELWNVLMYQCWRAEWS